jgi:hypothetical protein
MTAKIPSMVARYERESGRSRKTTTVSEEGKHGKFKRARERAVISY